MTANDLAIITIRDNGPAIASAAVRPEELYFAFPAGVTNEFVVRATANTPGAAAARVRDLLLQKRFPGEIRFDDQTTRPAFAAWECDEA